MFDCVLHFVSIPEKVRFKGLLSVLTSPALSRRYAAFEVPSNVLLKKLRPSVWLPLIMVLTGVVLLAQGFVSGYAGLMTARVMLGVVEAGLFPASLSFPESGRVADFLEIEQGVNYYLSHYYVSPPSLPLHYYSTLACSESWRR